MERNTNRTDGNRFETEICEFLSKRGWWVHNLAQNRAGQPADVIAVKHSKAILYDCKLCMNDRFDFRRVEPNQDAAMFIWVASGNKSHRCGFFLKNSKGAIYVLPYILLEQYRHAGYAHIGLTDTTPLHTLDQWLNELEDY